MYPTTRSLVLSASALLSVAWAGQPAALAQGTLVTTTRPAVPYGGYDPSGMTGIANVMHAQGEYPKQMAEAALKREQVRQERLVTERKRIEHYLWKQETLPSMERVRQRTEQEMIDHYANTASKTEIRSGSALNSLVKALANYPTDVLQHDRTPLNEDDVKQLSISGDAEAGGSIGILREFYEGQPLWYPRLMQQREFAPRRTEIEGLIKKAVHETTSGKEGGQTLDALESLLDDLDRELAAQARVVGDFSAYNHAKTFSRNLRLAARALSQPGASDFLTGRNRAQGKTVGELVLHMNGRGLDFGPATPTSDLAYTAVYNAVARAHRELAAKK